MEMDTLRDLDHRLRVSIALIGGIYVALEQVYRDNVPNTCPSTEISSKNKIEFDHTYARCRDGRQNAVQQLVRHRSC